MNVGLAYKDVWGIRGGPQDPGAPQPGLGTPEKKIFFFLFQINYLVHKTWKKHVFSPTPGLRPQGHPTKVGKPEFFFLHFCI